MRLRFYILFIFALSAQSSFIACDTEKEKETIVIESVPEKNVDTKNSSSLYAQPKTNSKKFFVEGVGLIKDLNTGSACIATEILDRCLLVPAKCVVNKERLFYYQNETLPDENNGQLHQDRGIKVIKYSQHPRYAGQPLSHLYDSYFDLALVWTGATSERNDPLKWKPWSLSDNLPPVGFPVDVFDLVPGPERSIMSSGNLSVSRYYINAQPGSGGFAELTSKDGVANGIKTCGAPVFQNENVFGIYSCREIESKNPIQITAFNFTVFANGNDRFVSLKQASSLAKTFCRPLIEVKVNAYPKDGGWISGGASDSLMPEHASDIYCGGSDQDKVQVCSTMWPSETIQLTATANAKYRFARWKGDERNSCPCDESNPVCILKADTVNWKHEIGEVDCTAEFEEDTE